jgi:hypothetical protein
MPRTVVYPPRAGQRDAGKAVAAAAPSPERGEVPKAPAPQPPTKEDGLGDKLMKYIPAEVIAFYVSGYVLAGSLGGKARWAVLLVCLFGTPAYLFIRADRVNPPRWYFYVLATLSFLAWAAGTSTVGADLFGWADPTNPQKAEIMGKFIVTAAVFLIPLTDELLTKLLPNAPSLPAPQMA